MKYSPCLVIYKSPEIMKLFLTWTTTHYAAVPSPNTALHFRHPSKLQRYKKAMCGDNGNSGLVTR